MFAVTLVSHCFTQWHIIGIKGNTNILFTLVTNWDSYIHIFISTAKSLIKMENKVGDRASLCLCLTTIRHKENNCHVPDMQLLEPAEHRIPITQAAYTKKEEARQNMRLQSKY